MTLTLTAPSEPDCALVERVTARLTNEPAIDLSNMAIAVHSGVVTLLGQVQSGSIRRMIQHAMKQVIGVEGIANDLVVRPVDEHSDASLALECLLALGGRVAVPRDITVTVACGRGVSNRIVLSNPDASARTA
jgi:hypothetical protein